MKYLKKKYLVKGYYKVLLIKNEKDKFCYGFSWDQFEIEYKFAFIVSSLCMKIVFELSFF